MHVTVHNSVAVANREKKQGMEIDGDKWIFSIPLVEQGF